MADTPSNPPGSRPALTESQWAEWVNEDDANGLGYGRYQLNHQPDVTVHEVRRYVDGITCNTDSAPEEFSPDAHDRHALAALCLYEQTFGFTAVDVQNLLAFAGEAEFATPNVAPDEIARSLASRIRALLPPPPP